MESLKHISRGAQKAPLFVKHSVFNRWLNSDLGALFLSASASSTLVFNPLVIGPLGASVSKGPLCFIRLFFKVISDIIKKQMFKKTTLKNGLRIITVPQKSTQAVTVLVLVGTGSKYETKETSGISHFLEHMFFKGTKKKPDKITIAETLDKVGGIYNAFTGEECTGYFAKVSALHFDLALDWVSDIYLRSLLPASEIAKEKGVIIEEINMVYDNPMAYVSTLWSKLLYGDQPAGWDIAGTKESVSNMDREKLATYMSRHYVAQNTVVCIAGNIREARTIDEVKKSFAGIKNTKRRRGRKRSCTSKKPTRRISVWAREGIMFFTPKDTCRIFWALSWEA